MRKSTARARGLGHLRHHVRRACSRAATSSSSPVEAHAISAPVVEAREAASILVYLPASSSLPKAFERVSEDVTRKSGYRFINVDTSELEQALRQGGWDLLLTDLADSAGSTWPWQRVQRRQWSSRWPTK